MSQQLVKNIWAVGRNYADHAKEMNAEVPKEPMFFLKAGSCLVTGSTFALPDWSQDVHHEIELAFLIDEDLNISHVALALDLTARDAQTVAKQKGQPWTMAKSFKNACPISSWVSIGDLNINELQFTLHKNKTLAQKGSASDMIFNVNQQLEYVKNRFPVSAHDILLSGTPEGVGPVKSNDFLEANLYWNNRVILSCHWDVI